MPSAANDASALLKATRQPSREFELRFPRPQGDRQLTNWIIDSNPNMMHHENIPITSALDQGEEQDEFALSGSFELVSSAASDASGHDTGAPVPAPR